MGGNCPSPGRPAKALRASSEVWSKAAGSHFTEDIAHGEEVAFPGPRVASQEQSWLSTGSHA